MFNLQNQMDNSHEATTSLEIDGVYRITKRKDGVVCKFYGSWNKENALAYSSAFKHCIENHYMDSQWSEVLDIAEWQFVSDDAIKILEELVSWAESNGQVANAYIYEGERCFDVFSTLAAKEYLSKIHYRKFPAIENSMLWLKKIGFNLANEPAVT